MHTRTGGPRERFANLSRWFRGLEPLAPTPTLLVQVPGVQTCRWHASPPGPGGRARGGAPAARSRPRRRRPPHGEPGDQLPFRECRSSPRSQARAPPAPRHSYGRIHRGRRMFTRAQPVRRSALHRSGRGPGSRRACLNPLSVGRSSHPPRRAESGLRTTWSAGHAEKGRRALRTVLGIPDQVAPGSPPRHVVRHPSRVTDVPIDALSSMARTVCGLAPWAFLGRGACVPNLLPAPCRCAGGYDRSPVDGRAARGDARAASGMEKWRSWASPRSYCGRRLGRSLHEGRTPAPCSGPRGWA